MNERAQASTLWTTSVADGPDPLQGIVVTEADIREMDRAAHEIDSTGLDERLRAFRTPVAADTLSRFVK